MADSSIPASTGASNNAGGLDLSSAPTDFAAVTDTALGTALGLWGSFVHHLPFVAGAIVILFLTWLIAFGVSTFGGRLLQHWRKRDSVKELILRLVTLLIWALGMMLAAIVLFPGLTPARAIGSLGLLSIAVGLAFKDIFENFFAGILILLRFPFENGDFIRCEDITGCVEKVLVRMTYIRETSGELVVVPNSYLFKNPVTVLTNTPERRIRIMTGVAYDVDVAAAVKIIDAAVKGCESVADHHPVEIFAQGFGDSSIDIEVCWWTGSTPLSERSSRNEVVTRIKEALDANDIEIPFPYRTLTFKDPLPIQQAER